jgi:hypothetical protein
VSAQEKRRCADCWGEIWGTDGVENPVGRGELHRACAERLVPLRREDRETGALNLHASEEA